MTQREERETTPTDSLFHRIDKAEQPLDELTKNLFQVHEECPSTHRHGEAALPNEAIIGEVLEGLAEIISPGYGRRQGLSLSDATYHLGFYASEVRRKLIEQVALDLAFSNPQERGSRDFRAEAEALVNDFSAKIPELVRRLEEDVTAAFYGDPAAKSLELILICYPGIKAVRVYRIANALHKAGLALIPRMMSEYAHRTTGIDIHPGAAIGKRFFIDHGTGVTIGETSVIGDDVIIYQGVTIGARKFAIDEHGHVQHNSEKRHPTIEDGVIIYANATILGGDTVIGSKTVIGSSTWVNKSVPPGMIVTIEEPRQRLAANRLLVKAEVEYVEAKELSDHEAFEIYLASIDRIYDL